MILCKYNDCGWCYAPDEIATTDDNGQCNNAIDCPQSIEIEEEE